MYPVSQDVINLFKANQYQQAKVEVFTPAANVLEPVNGVSATPDLTIGSDRILQNGLVVDRYCVTGEKLEIGTAIAAELTLKLNNRDGYFDDTVFNGKWLKAQVGIKDWSDDTAAITWIPLGWFVVDSAPRKLSTLTITALDFMALMDEPLSLTEYCDMAWAFDLDNSIWWATNSLHKRADGYLVPYDCVYDASRQSRAEEDLPYSSYFPDIPPKGGEWTLAELSAVIQPWISKMQGEGVTTMRPFIRWCAQLLGTCAYIDYTGALHMGWYTDTGVVITPADRYSSDLAEKDVTLTGVTFVKHAEQEGELEDNAVKVEMDAPLIAGDGSNAVDVSDNLFINSLIDEEQQTLDSIYGLVGGLTYRPFEARVKPCPYLWPMDKITYVDAEGISHSTIITNITFTINAPTSIAAKGGDGEENSIKSTLSLERLSSSVDGLEKKISGLNGLSVGKRWGSIPYIEVDGVMKVGKYLDFHSSDNADDTDYNARVACEGHELIVEADNFKISVSKGSFRPYYQAGDKLTGKWKGGGYVTTAKKEVVFTVPLAKPIVGNPTITVAASLIIRQGSKYTHGSASSTKVKPRSYEIERGIGDAICITCVMSDLTNAVNNDACAVAADLTITFS